jgi:dienelactone hydrolase
MPARKGPTTLHARLFLPNRTPGPHPLLIWLHSGGFRSGGIDHPVHARMGQDFACHGLATAFVEYRLRTKAANLSTQSQALLPDLQADAARFDCGLDPYFTGPAAIAAAEDCIVFFQWLDAHGARHGLGRRVLLGGSSAGAITVLNTLFLAPHLGIGLPHVPAAFVMSGAFAYPSFYAPNATRILAQHGPADSRIPVGSIRTFADLARAQCTLLEDPRQSHGGLRRNRAETPAAAVARLAEFAKSTAT